MNGIMIKAGCASLSRPTQLDNLWGENMPEIESFKLRRGTLINDEYLIKERLGKGWEGEVYRVREKFSNGERVLKLFNPNEYRSKQMEQYCKKAEYVSSINGVIKYYHAGYWEKKDCYYMVMEYFLGNTLQKLIDRHPLSLFYALKIIRRLFCI
jgi:serine/threonine protein kinase